MTTSAAIPFLWLPNLTGSGLEGGYVYIGTANTDPTVTANRISVFSDAACTVGLSQPLRTSGGFVVNGSGSPVNIYVAGTTDFSVTVQDAYNAALYSIAAYPVRLISSSITFDSVVIGTSAVPDAAGGAFVGTVTLPWSSMVSRDIQARNVSIYQDDQPAVAADLTRLSQLMMPLAGCIYRVAPTLSNAFNVSSVTVNGAGDYNVNLIVAAPAGIVCVSATADTAVRQAIADIDVGRTFIHVTTFNTNTGAAAASGFHLIATCDAAVADPIS